MDEGSYSMARHIYLCIFTRAFICTYSRVGVYIYTH